MNKLMLSLAVIVTAGVLGAQEIGAEAPQPVEDTASLAAVAVASDDGGAAIIAIVEEKSAEIAALPDDPVESALNKVTTDLENMGLVAGYDADKKAIIQIADAQIEIADPAKDPAFMVKREQIGNFAVLQAKADIIRAIYSEFSAMDRALTNYSEELDENQERFAAAREAVEAKRAELVDAIAKYNEADAQIIGEVTLNDRFGAFVDAMIKKIDTSYDPEALAKSKSLNAEVAKAEAEALKSKAQMLYAEYKALEEAAAKLPSTPALETESTATLLSKMPLLGAAVLTQAESWDPGDKQYHVAVAVVWSPKLQATAAKMGMGDFSAASKPGKFSKLDWVKAQDWSSMIGTRRFTDNKGNSYFVGIGAVDPGKGAQANAKRMLAETLARKNVAMSLIGDLETYREVKQNLKVYADQSTATKQDIVDQISSKVDLHLKGCMSLAKKEVKHPITGKKIYVCAYYIDPAMAKEASDAMKKMFADAGLVAQHTNKARGVVEGATSAYEAARTNPSARKEGIVEGASAVNAAVEANKREAAEKMAAAKAAAAKEKAAKAKAEQEAKLKAAQQAAEEAKAKAAEVQAAREAALKAAEEKRTAEEEAAAVSVGGTHSGGTIDDDF